MSRLDWNLFMELLTSWGTPFRDDGGAVCVRMMATMFSVTTSLHCYEVLTQDFAVL